MCQEKKEEEDEDFVDASFQGVKDDIKKGKERLIIATSKNTDNIKTNRTKTRKQKWEEKQPYRYFKW